jgi:BRCT domain type II-containing protein
VRKKKMVTKNKLNSIKGLKVCITGSLSRPRKEYQQLIIKASGEFVDEVSKSTDILVTNEPNSGSSKLKKAKEYGTKIISENELDYLLVSTPSDPVKESEALFMQIDEICQNIIDNADEMSSREIKKDIKKADKLRDKLIDIYNNNIGLVKDVWFLDAGSAIRDAKEMIEDEDDDY